MGKPETATRKTVMKQSIRPVMCAIPLAAMLFAAPQASAIGYGFVKLATNTENNADVSSQLSVSVTTDTDYVFFQFFNNVGTASTIAQIYFDSGALGALVITDSDGSGTDVEYSPEASPPDLPGGNNADPDFVATVASNASADAPAAHNGVNAAGEWVTLRFGLGSFASGESVQTALGNGDLRIGLHVIAIGGDNGGSDVYINQRGGGTPTGAPDGGTTIALLGIAMFGADLLRRRIAKT